MWCYNIILNAGRIAAIDEAGLEQEHDSDDSNAIHIKMKVTGAASFYTFQILDIQGKLVGEENASFSSPDVLKIA